MSENEAALLITCLRGQLFVVPRDTDWEKLLGLASAHGVLLIVHRSFIERGVETPEFFASAVRKSVDAAMTLAAELRSLLEEFSARSIEVLPLKGPTLAEALYGDATTRSCDDLDFLVRRKDFAQAQSALFDLGFVAPQKADDYHRQFVREELVVELHFDVASPRSFPFDLDGAWSRARQERFRNAPILAMADEDLLLFLCLHGLKHGFSKLIWVVDVAHALAAMPRGRFEELVQTAPQHDEQLLIIACEVVSETLPQKLPPEIEGVLADRPEARANARRVVAQLFAEPAETNHDPEIWGLYLQTESGARQRWRRRMTFLAPTVEDYAWAEKHRIHRGIAPIFRPFRLLRKYGPSRAWRILFPPEA